MPSTQDLDTSPEPQIEDSSPSTPLDSTSVEGGTTAPPAERDKSTGEDAESSIPLLGEGDVLDRLTNPTQKTNTQEDAKKEEPSATPEESTSTETEAESADNEEFKPADDKELAGYHSKTRHRIKQYQRELDRVKAAADFSNELVAEGHQLGLSSEHIQQWQQLGFGIRKGDPNALAALVDVLNSHGAIPKAQSFDPKPLRDVVEKLHRDMNLDDDAKEAIERVLTGVESPKAAAAPAQPQPPAPAPAQQQAPSTPPQTQYRAAYDQTVNWVRSTEAQDAQKFGAKYPEINKAIYAEATRREASLPLHIRNDPIEMRVRYAACREAVISKLLSRPPQPKVESSLRGSGAPTPLKVPERGTAEYDDYLMTHGIPPGR